MDGLLGQDAVAGEIEQAVPLGEIGQHQHLGIQFVLFQPGLHGLNQLCLP